MAAEGRHDEVSFSRAAALSHWSIFAFLRIAKMLYLSVFTQFRTQNRFALLLELVLRRIEVSESFTVNPFVLFYAALPGFLRPGGRSPEVSLAIFLAVLIEPMTGS
jgi:hypothetical protein